MRYRNSMWKMKKKYCLELKTVGYDVISVIKTYRELTGLPLKEAKDKVDAASCILLETFCLEEAERYKTELEACGATLHISDKKEKAASNDTKLKKISIEFILANVAVIMFFAAVLAGILCFLGGGDVSSFLSNCVAFALMFSPLSLFNTERNKITDYIVARTIKKNLPKHNFLISKAVCTNNANFLIDETHGKIAVVSCFAPWEFQVISAKNMEDIKMNYAFDSAYPNVTSYVYLQFIYQGKSFKFSTFRSRKVFGLGTKKVQDAMERATICADAFKRAKSINI